MVPTDAHIGIVVDIGLLETKPVSSISAVSRMTRGIPWVRVKLAVSLDGRSALANGVSQWSPAPRHAPTAMRGGLAHGQSSGRRHDSAG
jgi:hypothetical protein